MTYTEKIHIMNEDNNIIQVRSMSTILLIFHMFKYGLFP